MSYSTPIPFHDLDPMRRALRLAALGRGTVEPNPMVGCVIVKNGAVIGEGYHQVFGGPHAEPNALAVCRESAQGATAYVTLEPCCHISKKTPPCVPRLIEAGIRRVVVACLDPNPMVAGKGIAQLRSADVTIDEGILCSEAMQLNAAFFKRINFHRPYVTLKWAQSANGKVAGAMGRRERISNDTSLGAVHRLRGWCDAILVGIGTVLADDPLLTSRGVHNSRKPLRIILDKDLRIPVSSQLTKTTSHGPVTVYCADSVFKQKMASIAALTASGVNVRPLPLDDSKKLSLNHLLDDLGSQDINHLLVEPGPTLAQSFIEQDLADRVWIIRSQTRIEDPTALAAVSIDYQPTGEIGLDGDRLTEYLNRKSPVYYTLARSADFLGIE